MITDEVQLLVNLIRYFLKHKQIQLTDAEQADLSNVMVLAEKHGLMALAASALKESGYSAADWLMAEEAAVRRRMLFDIERQNLLSLFERAGIWYMPLKGAVIQNEYPGFGLREMSDNDILFDEDKAEEVRSIMEEQGFETIHFGQGYQDDYQKMPVYHFEMHRMLFAQDDQFYWYFKDIKDKLVKNTDSRFGYHLSDEDFYIYMIAHEYKHYSWRGTGLRSLLDTYIFLRNRESFLDWDYLEKEFTKLALLTFEKDNRELAKGLFGTGILTGEQEKMLDYITDSGTYGTEKNNIRNQIMREGKGAYIKRRIFLPMKSVKKHYPFFYRHKWLLPVLPLYRLVHRKKKAMKEIRLIREKTVR